MNLLKQSLEKNSNWKKKYVIVIIKIAVISFFSFYLIDNPFPWYDGSDSTVYGITSIDLANGTYGFTNEFMQRFHGGPFIAGQWVSTIHDTAIPIIQIGIVLVGATVYLLAGPVGLYYIGPISAVFLFISIERIGTKLFGPIPGLVALILFVTSFMVLWTGRVLGNDIIFSLFLILGFFYFVKFFNCLGWKNIFLASVFFSLSTVFRINGIIFFPIELISFSIFFIYATYFSKSLNALVEHKKFKNMNSPSKNFSSKQINMLKNRILSRKNKKIIKFSILMLIPWLIFITFFLSFNNYYFGDPFTTYASEHRLQKTGETVNFLASSFVFDSDRFEWIKYYSIGLIPHNLNEHLRNVLDINDLHFINHNWISIFVFSVFAFSIIITYFSKFKRVEVILILFLIFGTLLFYTTNSVTPPYKNAAEVTNDIQFRYMIPNFALFSVLIGFITSWVLKTKSYLISIKIKNFRLNFFKIIFFTILFLFLGTLIYDSDARVHYSIEPTFNLTPPNMDEHLKLTRSELPENGIIISQYTRWAVVYWDGIQFLTPTGWNEGKWNVSNINQEDIQIIKISMEEGHEFFSIKSMSKEESYFFRYLEKEHDLILKNTFPTASNICKLTQVSDEVDSKAISDDNCYGRDRRFVEKFS